VLRGWGEGGGRGSGGGGGGAGLNHHHHQQQQQQQQHARTHAANRHTHRTHHTHLTHLTAKQIKIAELPLDSFRMLQALEWEDAYSQPGVDRAVPLETPTAASAAAMGSGSKRGGGSGRPSMLENGSAGSGSGSGGPSPFENPSKHMVYRPTSMQLLSILTTTMEVLPQDGVLLLYLSAAGGAGLLRTAVASASTSNLTSEISPADSPHPDNASDVSGLSISALTIAGGGAERGLNLGPTKAQVRGRGGGGVVGVGVGREGGLGLRWRLVSNPSKHTLNPLHHPPPHPPGCR